MFLLRLRICIKTKAFFSFDRESKLYKDLQTLKKQDGGGEGVLLSMTFTVSSFAYISY